MKAETQSSKIPGVRIKRWGWATLYQGTLEDLLAAGLGLQRHFFADGTKRDKRGRCVRSEKGLVDGRKVDTIWHRERKKYSVYIHNTVEERAQFEAAQERENEVEFERKYAAVQQELTRKALAEVGPKGMAQACLDGGGLSLIAAFNMTDDPKRPYRFSEETKARVKELFQEILWLFEHGGFEPRLGAIAAGDPAFQRFIQQAAGPTGGRPSS